MNPSGHETGGNDRPDHASKYVEEKSEEVADWSERRYRERRDWDSPFPLHEVGQDSLAPIPFESQVVRGREKSGSSSSESAGNSLFESSTGADLPVHESIFDSLPTFGFQKREHYQSDQVQPLSLHERSPKILKFQHTSSSRPHFQPSDQWNERAFALSDRQSSILPSDASPWTRDKTGQRVDPAIPSEVEDTKLPFPSQHEQQRDIPFSSLLPSTMIPPTVLASVVQGRAKKGKQTVSQLGQTLESPQKALERILIEQGHGCVKRLSCELAEYETTPSPLQLASFGTEVIKAVESQDTELMSRLLVSGLSPNPCNRFRDSVLDLTCKRAKDKIFRCLIEFGCDIRVCDGFGRTPLHHCCWSSQFSKSIASSILDIDMQQLFMTDKQGRSPLEYVRQDQFGHWVAYLESEKHSIFPKGGTIALAGLNRRYGLLQDPPNALPVDIAAAVSCGRILPEEAVHINF